jgi:hypothetical protein
MLLKLSGIPVATSIKSGETPKRGYTMLCNTLTEWGRCQQEPVGDNTYCYYHMAQQGKDFHTDENYHKKIVLGLLEPTGNYLDQTEVDSMFAGRMRNDGRRLDKYIS